jgi:hypothetical protein
MRHSPVIFTTMRKAVEDVELAGVRMPAGMQVIVNTAAANRDPAVYDDPDRLDITCEGPATMLTFGGGIHYCLMITLPSTLTTVDLQHGYRSSGPLLGVRPLASARLAVLAYWVLARCQTGAHRAVKTAIADSLTWHFAAAVLFSGSVPRVSRRSHNSSETHHPDQTLRTAVDSRRRVVECSLDWFGFWFRSWRFRPPTLKYVA